MCKAQNKCCRAAVSPLSEGTSLPVICRCEVQLYGDFFPHETDVWIQSSIHRMNHAPAKQCSVTLVTAGFRKKRRGVY